MQPAALFASGLAAGLLAGTASCTAVQGGLLAGLAGAPPRALAHFLLGRLASHILAGALLGLLGSAVRLPPQARAVLLVAAGALVIWFAVRLLRRPGGDCARHPPTPRRAAAAPLLGAATILIPCGVTIGMELVAVSSGSALGGAAVMGGFVAGTAPAFAVLGFVLRRGAASRLAALAGIAALAVGVWTIGSGLSLGGWLPADAPPASATARLDARGVQEITIWATDRGYRPGMSEARAGLPVDLIFRTLDGHACTRHLSLLGQEIDLPAGGERIVSLPAQPPGQLRFVCSMGMYVGFITFH
ncbi:sulfite exporter TauE/SafE family protein [Nonomuraea sp. NPDC046570]|uniref:urease accessory protein UreH domain-containing protein n=1 Tax=Nonomuraea sp. NPDC046570 TaxID=3155255 RepID=UPI0033E25B44